MKVNPTVSSFLSGIGAIITELKLRTARNERVGTYTVIGTALSLPESRLGRMLQTEAALLFNLLTAQYQSFVVVSAGRIAENTPDNVWPAKLAQYPGTPILVASGALYSSGPILRPPARSFLTLYGPSLATCIHINRYVRITGISLAVAIITALAADMPSYLLIMQLYRQVSRALKCFGQYLPRLETILIRWHLITGGTGLGTYGMD